MRTRVLGTQRPTHDLLCYRTQQTGIQPLVRSPVNSADYIQNYSICTDEVHPDHPKSGGPLFVNRVTTMHQDWGGKAGYKYKVGNYNYEDLFIGSFRAEPVSKIVLMPTLERETESYGPDAWNRFKPGKPILSVSQFIAELKDFPSMFRARLKRFKDMGNLYLNVQFGWKPFLSDVRSYFKSLRDLDRQIAELRNKNGKTFRSGGVLFDTTSPVTITKYTNRLLYPSNYMSGGSATREVHTNDRCWFEGAFRYYIPGLDDPEWGRFRAVRHLYDLSITPTLLWELMPWSWLADWCSNAGSVISNLTDSVTNNLAAKYAYLMRHITQEDVYQCQCAARLKIGSSSSPYIYSSASAVTITTTDQKIRVEATPFGFGLNWSAFSAYQLSILVALGLSRLG